MKPGIEGDDMSPKDAWHALGLTDLKDLEEARLQAHYGAQWAARTARAFVEAQPDDSHTSLSWDRERQALRTQALPGGQALGLRLADLTLIWLEADEAGAELPLEGMSDADAGAWVAERVTQAGYDAARLDEPSPYELPPHNLAKGGVYAVGSNEGAFAELSAWFDSADAALEAVVKALSDLSPGPSPVRCWPHHFDIATLVALEPGDAEEARSIGVGLSPGDEAYAEPYYYVTPWPYPDPGNLPTLPPSGRWHTEGYVGAIATASRIGELGSKRVAVMDFLQSSIARSRELLDK
jgi:hypothetical protein